MDYKNLILARQSCRAYDAARTVSRDVLAEILDAARLAPSACNRQPYHYFAVTGEAAHRLAPALQGEGMNPFASDCPAFVVVTDDVPASEPRTSEHYASVDIGLAVSQLVCRAQELGVSSCIIGWFEEAAVQSIVNTSAHVRLVVALGYAAPGDALRAKKRKTAQELISWVE